MSTISPDHHKGLMRAPGSAANMAAAQTVKAKPASKAKTGAPKTKSQMHRRSRTGSSSFHLLSVTSPAAWCRTSPTYTGPLLGYSCFTTHTQDTLIRSIHHEASYLTHSFSIRMLYLPSTTQEVR